MKSKYSFSDYNDELVLKIPFNLWFYIVYLARHFLFVVIVAVSMRFTPSVKNLMPSDGLDLILSVFSSVPALLVLIAALNRTRQAGSWVRWIWAMGWRLLLASVTIDLFLALIYRLKDLANMDLMQLLFLAFDVSAVAFLLTSKRTRDTFSEFPAAKS